MLAIVKTNLRLSNNSFDAVIVGLINACIADLRIAGVEVPDYSPQLSTYGNALIDSCIICYCKMNFGLAYDDSFEKAYINLKHALVFGGEAIE